MIEYLQDQGFDGSDRDKLDRLGKVNMAVSMGDLTARRRDTNDGVHVEFNISTADNIDVVELLRGTSADIGLAVIVQSFTLPQIGPFAFDDIDTSLLGKRINYWLRARGGDDTSIVGPTACDLTGVDLTIPGVIDQFDVSHAAAAAGRVLVTVSYRPKADSRFSQCRIYVTGYKGIAIPQSVAQGTAKSFTFALQATGETITVYAAAVAENGNVAAQAAWLSKALTLSGGATVPTKLMTFLATSLSTGVQIDFEVNDEAGILDFKIYRGPRGGGFGAASVLTTIAVTGARRYTYTDTAVIDVYDWFVVARNATGIGAGSDAFNPTTIFNSSLLPPNSPSNAVSKATVDSVDNGTNATIRVYGGGGVGSAWSATFGFGDRTFPYATLTGNYSTTYYITYDTVGGTYQKSLILPDTMPDNYVFAGKVGTVAGGGGGGTTGGGGPSGDPDGCPEVNTWLTRDLQAKDVIPGESKVRCVDQVMRTVKASQIKHNVPCVRLRAERVIFAKISKVVSWDTPCTLPDGSSVIAREMGGKKWLTDLGWLTCTVEEVGLRDVVKIDVGGETFAGSETREEFSGYTHNMQKL